MARKEKVGLVDQLSKALENCDTGILTDYQGLSAAELTILRRKLRQSGIDYRVVKNTLARFAAKKAGKDFLSHSFTGPVAIAFSYDETIEPAKVVAGYIQSSSSALSIKGGFLADRLLSVDEVNILAKIPPREVLLAQVLAGIQGPQTALLYFLTYPLRQLPGILQARIKQLEEE
jgi:large subunit ribosomal protein L10